MLSLLTGTLRLRWPAMLGTFVVLAMGTAIVGANAGLLATAIRQGFSELIAMSAVFGGLSVMLMVTIVAVVFSLTMNQRRPEIALSRAIGVSPGQLRWLVALEALLLGAVGTIAGLALAAPVTAQIATVAADAGIVSSDLATTARLLPSLRLTPFDGRATKRPGGR